MAIAQPDRSQTPRVVQALIGCAALICCWLVVMNMVWMHRGFDISDEGFYLHFMRNPDAYQATVTHFGYVYRSLFAALNGDIAQLRIAMLLLLLALGFICARSYVLCGGYAAWAGFCSLLAYQWWLPTPNYNLLALQAYLVAFTGLALLLVGQGRPRLFLGVALVAAGGVLAFAAKPTAAAALAVLVLASGVLRSKQGIGAMLLAALLAVVLLLVAAVMWDGGMLQAVERMQRGLQSAALLAGDGEARSWLRLVVPPYHWQEWLGAAVVGGLTLLACVIPQRSVRGTYLLAGFLLLLLLAVPLCHAGNMLLSGGGNGVLLLVVPLTVMLARRRGWLPTMEDAPAHALVIVLLLAPFGLAVGTNNNYWVQASMGGYFWVLAALLMVRGAPRTVVIMLLIVCSTLTAMRVDAAQQKPYRQPEPLANMDTIIVAGTTDAALRVSAETSALVEPLRAALLQHEFTPGTPLIDLTGRAPGMVYAVGGKAIGVAWLLSGYAGSARYMAAVLNGLPCAEIVPAWLIVPDHADAKAAMALLTARGLRYQRVASLGKVHDARSPYASIPPYGLYRPHSGVCREAASPRSE